MGSTQPRVLLVSQPTTAGVAQCVLDWSAGLAERGWDVAVACPGTGWLSARCAGLGVPTYPWRAVRSPYSSVVAEVRSLLAVVADWRPDVVHLNSSKAGLAGRIGLRGRIPTAFSPHSWSFEASPGATARLALAWERIATNWTDCIICVSEAERSAGLARGIRAPYEVARNGVDTTSLVPPTVAGRSAMRAQLGIGDGETAVVCVGRLQEQKGQDVLLAAWPEIAAAGGRVLYIVGGGPDEQVLRSRSRRDDVRFVGETDRVAALRWLAAADLVVVPSRWEGMALVPLESLAMGTPVVASDVTGLSEAVDEWTGRLVPPDDPGALADAVNSWLAKDARSHSQVRAACRTRAVEQFDLSATVEAVSEALRRTARRATQGGPP